MSAAQGKKVEKLCRKSIDKDFGYTLKESNYINKKIDDYITEIEKDNNERV